MLPGSRDGGDGGDRGDRNEEGPITFDYRYIHISVTRIDVSLYLDTLGMLGTSVNVWPVP